jgi:BlaI family transcriptional regulator, penicillinase repressor
MERDMRLTQAEWQVMNALWEKHPATARDVTGRLPEGTNWAYSTVKTMLGRLAVKGAVAEEKGGPAIRYEPLVTRRKARLAALKAVAEEAFDGALGTLMHFIVDEELSPEDRAKLAKLLDEKAKKGGRK